MKTYWTSLTKYHQRQSPGGVKFSMIYWKAPVSQSLFNKAAGQYPTTLLKKEAPTEDFPVSLGKLSERLFTKHPRMTASML